MTLKRQEYCHRDSRPSQWDPYSGCLTLGQRALPDQSIVLPDQSRLRCNGKPLLPRLFSKKFCKMLKDLLCIVEHDCILSCNCIDQSVGESKQAKKTMYDGATCKTAWRRWLQCIAFEKPKVITCQPSPTLGHLLLKTAVSWRAVEGWNSWGGTSRQLCT